MTPIEMTDRQSNILSFIRRHIDEEGYPPTVREIGSAFGIRSTNGVADHLKALERKGYLDRTSLTARGLRVVSEQEEPGELADVTSLDERRQKLAAAVSESRPAAPNTSRLVSVPLLGQVCAGAPISSQPQAHVTIDASLLGNHKRVFALRMAGDSMIGDGIFDGDYIFVKKQNYADNGEIVVAMINGAVAVRRVYREGDRIRFQPSNPRMLPIYVHKRDYSEQSLIGIVVGVYRRW